MLQVKKSLCRQIILYVDKTSFHFAPPLDVLLISLLDTKQNKETLVGKYTRSKSPNVDNPSLEGHLLGCLQ